MLRIVLVLALLLGGPVLAESQSSDSSSNCSNGRCTRVERFTREEGGRVRERRVIRESWREGRREPPRGYYSHRYDAPYPYGDRRRYRAWEEERRGDRRREARRGRGRDDD